MEKIAIILGFAVLVEGTVEYVKLGLQKNLCGEIIGAFCFSLLICIAYDFDLFAVLGASAKYPYVGNVMTALVISRGANYAWDLIGKFTEFEQKSKSIEMPADEEEVDNSNVGEG